jgi:hypothetical protein
LETAAFGHFAVASVMPSIAGPTLFLAFLFSGIICLVSALFVTRQTWRADIEPFNRRSRLFEIALHPERFATPDRLHAIRWLNFAGFVLILCAVAVVTYDISATIWGDR